MPTHQSSQVKVRLPDVPDLEGINGLDWHHSFQGKDSGKERPRSMTPFPGHLPQPGQRNPYPHSDYSYRISKSGERLPKNANPHWEPY